MYLITGRGKESLENKISFYDLEEKNTIWIGFEFQFQLATGQVKHSISFLTSIYWEPGNVPCWEETSLSPEVYRLVKKTETMQIVIQIVIQL
jgi:hypothetical protein